MGNNTQPAAKRELRIWLRESDYRALKIKAEMDGSSQSEIARQAITRYLGEDAAEQSAPWLADMFDAILARYFQGFPAVLSHLVATSYEQHTWQTSQFAKLLELSGIKDATTQDQRTTDLAQKIRQHAQVLADQFFQELTLPEELIEPGETQE